MRIFTNNLMYLSLFLIFTLFFCLPANAEFRRSAPPAGLSAGIGGVISDKPYKGMDTDTNFFPFFMYEGPKYYLRGPQVGYKILKNEKLQIDAILNWRFSGFEVKDSPIFVGMEKRDMTAEMGVAFSWRLAKGVTRISFQRDVLGKHKGNLLSFSHGRTFRYSKCLVTPSIGVNWQDGNFVDYYYGVRSLEALVTRPTYTPSAAVNPFVALRVIRPINSRWSFYANLRYQWLDSEISNSPLVDQDTSSSSIFGLIRKF